MTTAAPELVRIDIPRDTIDVPGDNVRNNGHVDHALADSIADVGLLQPVVVAIDGDTYQLAGGFRRIAAIDHLIADGRWPKARKIPATVAHAGPGENTDRLVAMLVENLLRRDLDPIEEAGGYFRLIDLGMTKTDLARRVNRSEHHVAGRLQLLALVPELQGAVSDGALPLGKAAELAAAPVTAQVKVVEAAKTGSERMLDDARDELQDLYTDAGVDKVADVDPEFWADCDPDQGLEYFTTLEAEVLAGKVPLQIEGYQVDRLIDEARTAVKVAAAREEWEAKGVTVVDDDKAPGISRQSYTYGNEIWLGEKGRDAHPNEPCAAVRISAYYQRVEATQVCTDPKRHDPKTGDSDLKIVKTRTSSAPSKTPAQKRAEALDRLEKRHQAEQLEHVLGGTVKQADAIELLSELVFRNGHSMAAKTACEILGLDPVVEKTTYGEQKNWAQALSTYAAKSAANRIRAALLHAAVEGLGFESSWQNGPKADDPLMPKLTALGWQPFDRKAAEAELKKTEAAAKKPAKKAAPRKATAAK